MTQKKILTLDDDPDFNKLIKAILNKNGYEVSCTETPEDFLEQLKQNQCNLCLVDLNLGHLYGAGFQIIKAIRKIRGYELPLLVVSRRSAQEDIAFAIGIGATDYIQKPIDEATLLSRITFALNEFDNEESSNFPYFKISEKLGEANIELDIEIEKIDELGIQLSSYNLISKGTQIYLSGEFIEEIFGADFQNIPLYVSKNWIENEINKIYIPFNTEDMELMSRVRTWIKKKNA